MHQSILSKVVRAIVLSGAFVAFPSCTECCGPKMPVSRPAQHSVDTIADALHILEKNTSEEMGWFIPDDLAKSPLRTASHGADARVVLAALESDERLAVRQVGKVVVLVPRGMSKPIPMKIETTIWERLAEKLPLQRATETDMAAMQTVVAELTSLPLAGRGYSVEALHRTWHTRLPGVPAGEVIRLIGEALGTKIAVTEDGVNFEESKADTHIGPS